MTIITGTKLAILTWGFVLFVVLAIELIRCRR